MFGYVKPIVAELKVKEYEIYKSIYCGLCVALGKNTSCISRLTLSYDFVFLALVRMALAKECGNIEKHRCIAHPTKKRSVVVNSSQLEYCARVSALLTYWKLRDDIDDEKGTKRLRAYVLLPAASSMRKRALSKGGLETLDDMIGEKLRSLSKLETDKIYSPDAAAEIFGEIMAETFSFGLEPPNSRIAFEIGRHIGRFVYISDAADDLNEDLENERYNPFRIAGESDDKVLEGFELRKEALRTSLLMELSAVERAVDIISEERVFELLSIIRNIIYLGLPDKVDSLLGSSKDNVENL